MVSRHALLVCAFLGITASAGCGAASRPEPDSHVISGSGTPILTAVVPESAAGSDTVTLEGLGFSFVAQENIVSVGGASVVADAYAISEEGAETLSFTVPETAVPGDTEVLVIVDSNASNPLPFTVEPTP